MKPEPSYTPIGDINVTPFIDVLLVLLVIFMMTAPILTSPININLPEENIKSAINVKGKEYSIGIKKSGKYYLDREEVPLSQIVIRLSERYNEKDSVAIRADKDTKYKSITALMAALRRNNITNVNLLVSYSPK